MMHFIPRNKAIHRSSFSSVHFYMYDRQRTIQYINKTEIIALHCQVMNGVQETVTSVQVQFLSSERCRTINRSKCMSRGGHIPQAVWRSHNVKDSITLSCLGLM